MLLHVAPAPCIDAAGKDIAAKPGLEDKWLSRSQHLSSEWPDLAEQVLQLDV